MQMVCYFENWAQYRPGVQRMVPSDIDANLCTHVLYSFAQVKNGVLEVYEPNDFRKLLLAMPSILFTCCSCCYSDELEESVVLSFAGID